MNEYLTDFLSSDLAVLAMAALVFVGIVSVFFAGRYLLGLRVNKMEQRMKRTVARRTRPTELEDALQKENGKPKQGIFARGFQSIGRLAKPMDEEGMGRLKAKLAHAGYRGDRAVLTYLAIKILFALLVMGGLFAYNVWRIEPIQNFAAWVIIGVIAGFYTPALWIRNRVAARQKEINRALPDALDLLVTCVESGLGLDASINRVGEEVAMSAPLLASELMQASFEIRAGSARGEAFRRVADRTGVEELRNLSALVVQSERFGTSVAKTLRVMADGMRVRRGQRAEERAATASVKMTLPLVFCIFPTLLIIILGPAVIKMIDIFSGVGN